MGKVDRADDNVLPMDSGKDDEIVSCNKKVGSRDRYQYIKAARELGYPLEVIEKIERAETEIQVNQILARARHEGKYAKRFFETVPKRCHH